jgi:hypothetical protein
MADDIVFDYDVKCRTCSAKFKVQMFDTHERNLYLVDNKYWFCNKCKKDYFSKETLKFQESNTVKGFGPLEGVEKSISWAEKIRFEMINKFELLKQTITYKSDEEKEIYEKAFDIFLKEWFVISDPKWWIEKKRMNVRDITLRVEEIKKELMV